MENVKKVSLVAWHVAKIAIHIAWADLGLAERGNE